VSGTTLGRGVDLINVGGMLVFNGQGGIWSSDGTVEGTSPLLSGAQMLHPTAIGDYVYFWRADNAGKYELWATDGTTHGTKSVFQSQSTSTPAASRVVDVNGTIYFASDLANESLLAKIDPTSGEVIPILTGRAFWELTAFQGRLYFFSSSTSLDTGLWTSDGSISGTYELNRFRNPKAVSTSVAALKLFAGQNALFMSANDWVHGVELWVSDGTAQGTRMLGDLSGETSDAVPSVPIFINGIGYFTANDGIHGRELWRTDGTATGTWMVKDIFSLKHWILRQQRH